MNTRSMTNKNIINNNNSSNQKDEFINSIRNLIKLHEQSKNPDYKCMKIRLQTVIDIAKKVYKNLPAILPEIEKYSAGRLISTIYLKLHQMMCESKNVHIRDYLVKENKILKVRKLGLKVEKKCRKSLFVLYNLMENMDKLYIPLYYKIISLQNKLQNNYNLRPRNNIYYGEEDGNFDDPTDADYIFEEDEDDEDDDYVFKNNSNNTEDDYDSDDDEKDDNDSDYNPQDDADDTDDEEFQFDEEEDEEDETEDNEDDELDRQLLSDYLNDPDYNPDEDEDDDLIYLNNKVYDNENIVLKAGIIDDNDEEETEEDLEDNSKNILNICKRRFENGKIVYRWLKMTKEEAEKKYDEDYICEEN